MEADIDGIEQLITSVLRRDGGQIKSNVEKDAPINDTLTEDFEKELKIIFKGENG